MIALAIVYAALAVLAGAVVAGVRAPFWTRLVIVAAAPVVAFAVWQSAQPPTGWPATARPPKDAAFVWANIREPDQLSRDPGEIDVWLVPAGADQPRSYRLPYTRQLHQQAQRAMQAGKAGTRLRVRLRNARQHVRFVFYREPPPRLPTK